METDKIVIEIAASAAGSIARLNKKEGETIRRGDSIAQIETDGASSAPQRQAEPAAAPVVKISAPAPASDPEAPAPAVVVIPAT